MGGRISISFRKNGRESPALFSHWDGMSLLVEAEEYAKELVESRENAHTFPLDRLEPETVLVDFIRHLTKHKDRVRFNYYVCSSPDDGDNSDNGHHVVDLDEIEWMVGKLK